jgi:predicted ATPase/HPt (histidine-containing phosphotransfer) domain-containing protein
MGLEGYDIGEVIAQSSNSVVRRAIRRGDGARVVLKIHAKEYPSAREIGQLAFEHRILQKLAGPSIVRVFDLVPHGDRLALVLEDFGGSDLSSEVGRISLDSFFRIAAGVVRGLQTVHRLGVIHKDVNPRNVLLNPSTTEVKLIDFGIATELSQERQAVEATSQIEGTLPYVSPEQTGRMNRDLDYRTDYYSLGVTFFELLTGALPFAAQDTMGWVHSHISRPVANPRALNDAIPEDLARLVLRLLAKNPEDRYQSSHGLLHDLEACRRAWIDPAANAGFALGREDVPERFQVSQKLFGREHEVDVLHRAFDGSAQGPAKLLLVGGYSGVGKSALIHELHKDIVRGRGHFVAGKFDQLDRNVPYGAVLHALRALVKQLLGEPEAHLTAWRQAFATTVKASGRVLTDLVPELEEVVGPQPAIPALQPREAHARFQRVFADFLRCAATAQHPLVVFIDDMQWTDPSTPELLQHLLSDQGLEHVLFIGSYRDNEVPAGHVLRALIRELRERRPAAVQEIQLAPLAEADVNRIVADTLHCEPESCRAISGLIAQKTGGNPFFVKELLGLLFRDGVFHFDAARGRWDWDEERIARAALSDNVVELMVQRLQRLPPETIEVLRLAACLGNSFELHALARVADAPADQVATALWQAVRERVLVPVGSAYRLVQEGRAYDEVGLHSLGVRYQFQHDRVQQAAYSLVSAADRPRIHLAIGRLLTASEGSRDEDLFDTVNHLNLGRSLVVDPAERRALSRLNEAAGARAKRAAAYAVAAGYFATAVDLLTPEERADEAERIFECARSKVECVFHSGDPDRARVMCDELANLASDRWSRVAVLELKAQILDHEARLLEAIATLREGLRLMNVELPEDMDAVGALIGQGIGKMQAHLARVSVEELVNLPAMADREKITIAKLLFHLVVPSIQACPPLFILAELMMFDLALTAGTTDFSCKNFVDCGIIQGGILGDHDRAYRLGKVAFELLKRDASKPLSAAVSFVFAAFVSHWRAPYRESLTAFSDAERWGVELGDNSHATYAHAIGTQRWFFTGRPLRECEEKAERAEAFLTQLRAVNQLEGLRLVQRAIARLRGRSSGGSDDEFTARLLAIGNAQWIFLHAHAQCFASIILGDFEAAGRWEALAVQHDAGGKIQYSYPDHQALSTILLARKWAAAGEDERAALATKIDENLDRLKIWASSSPGNYAAKYKLAAAEVARLRGEPMERTMALYDEALALAGDDFLPWRALTSELHAEYWQQKAQPKIARVFLSQARGLYERWGASAKVRQMAEVHGQALEASAEATHPRVTTQAFETTRGTGAYADGALDLESMIKATQAISSEMKPERLFARLMTTILENAGAQRGSLVFRDDSSGDLYVEASAPHDDKAGEPAARVLVDRSSDLSPEIVRYVARTGATVVIDDAAQDATYCEDPHVRAQGVKSVLCMPVLHQSKLLAILYVENNAAARAFTPQRLRLLQVIASQASISITNARLYDSMEDRVEARTRELAQKKRDVEAMLNSMQQGLFTIDETLTIQPEYSAHLEQLLGTRDIAGREFLPLLFARSEVNADTQRAMRAAVQFSFDVPPLVAGTNSDHLVRQFQRIDERGERRDFEADWTFITNDAAVVSKILVTVRDVTVLKELAASVEQKSRELDMVGQILDAGVHAFERFCSSARVLLVENRAVLSPASSPSRAEIDLLFRNVHTVKGNARMLGLSYLVEVTHEAESVHHRARSQGRVSVEALGGALAEIEAALGGYEAIYHRKLEQLANVTQAQQAAALAQIGRLVESVSAGAVGATEAVRSIGRMVDRANGARLQDIVRETARTLPSLARELGRLAPEVECSDGGVSVTPDWAQALRGALVHALRNALDHGIETPDERRQKGKPAQGRLAIQVSRRDRGAQIVVRDDGRGLDLAALRARLGDSTSDDAHVAEQVFAAGVSTAAQVSDNSGRGVGMDAIRSFVRRLGGEARVVLADASREGCRPFDIVIDLPEAAIASWESSDAPLLSEEGPSRPRAMNDAVS